MNKKIFFSLIITAFLTLFVVDITFYYYYKKERTKQEVALLSFMEKTKEYKISTKTLSKSLKLNKKGERKSGYSEITFSRPHLLARISEIAYHNELFIHSIYPSPLLGDKLSTTFEFASTYSTLIQFIATVEKQGFVILGLKLHHFNPELEVEKTEYSTPHPMISVSVSLAPHHDVFSDQYPTYVKTKFYRDPFQRFTVERRHDDYHARIDLSWIYKLENLENTQKCDSARINGQDYLMGDELDGRKIVEIQDDFLLMEKKTKNGQVKYILRFRKKPFFKKE